MGCASPGNTEHFSGSLAIKENKIEDNCPSALPTYQESSPFEDKHILQI